MDGAAPATIAESVQEPRAPGGRTSPLRLHVIRNASKLSAASIVSNGASLLNAYAAAVLLGPLLFGIWQAARIVLQVGSTLHLGTAFGMNREVPILEGRGDAPGQRRLIEASVTFTVLMGFVAAVVLGALAALLPLEAPWRWTLASLAVVLPLQQVTLVFGMALSAKSEFGKVSRITLAGAGATFATIGLAFVAGYEGFLVGRVAASAVVAVASVLAWSEPLHLRLHRPALASLVRVGLPILLITLGTGLFVSADRIVVLGAFDASALGLYALGAVLFTPVAIVFSATKSVMYPLFGTRYGATADPLALRRLVLAPLEALALPLALAVGLIYLAAPVLVPIVLPSYLPGLEAARVLLWAFFVFYLTGNVSNFFLTINQQTRYLALLAAGLALSVAASWTAASAGWGLAGIALVQLFANVAFFSVALVLALRASGGAQGTAARSFAKALAPAAAVMAAVLLLDVALPTGEPAAWSATAAKMVLLTLIFVPWLWKQAKPLLPASLVPSLRWTPERRELASDAWLAASIVLTTASAITLAEFPAWMGGALNIGVVLLGLWMVGAVLRLRREGLVWNPIAPVVAAFWGIAAVLLILGTFVALGQGILSYRIGYTIPAYAFTATAVMLFTMLPRTEQRLRRIAPLVVGFSVLPLLAWLVIHPPPGTLTGGFFEVTALQRFHGWALNPNQLAILLVMVPFLGAHLASQATGQRRWLYGGLTVAAVAVGLSTRSEALFGGWVLGLLAACAVVGWDRVQRRLQPTRRQRNAILAGVTLVAAVSFAAAFPWLEANATGVLNPGNADRPDHLEGRSLLWRNGLEAWALSPVVGLGPGAYSGAEPLGEFGAHNTFIDWATQTGILGVALLVVLLGGVLSTALRAGNARLVGGLVALVFLAMFHFVLKHPAVWYDLAVVMAICGPVAWPRLASWPRKEVPAPVQD